MNAQHEIDRLLDESGAVLVRQNKHLVYRLPNGRNFVAPKTSSDPVRAAKNGLSDLRHALGIESMSISRESVRMHEPQESRNPMEARIPVTPPSAPVGDQRNVLRLRVEAMIADEEAAQEALMAEAQQLERRVQMLKALLPFADDPATEAALRAIASPLPAPAAPAVVAPTPEPPQHVTERVQVTRQLVFAATQTFEETFTVNDILALMTGGREIEAAERLRVRAAIAQAMVSLHERGELIRESEGYGRRQATWKKAPLNRNASGLGTRA